jgi:serine/threonine protein kinase
MGSFRQYIINSEAPPVDARLRMAGDFADGVHHLHERGVIWGDASVRNSLLFDNFRVRLCDFGGAILKGTDYKISQTHETRYTPLGRDQNWEQTPIMTREISALGSAVYEITEWEVQYDIKATFQAHASPASCNPLFRNTVSKQIFECYRIFLLALTKISTKVCY